MCDKVDLIRALSSSIWYLRGSIPLSLDFILQTSSIILSGSKFICVKLDFMRL